MDRPSLDVDGDSEELSMRLISSGDATRPLPEEMNEGVMISGVERVSSSVKRDLYVSHFLSTWNSRLFEFAAFLFLSNAYPQTLIPASLYALARAASVIMFSSFLGKAIDQWSRIRVIRISIRKLHLCVPLPFIALTIQVGMRISTALSCALLYIMTSISSSEPRTKIFLLAPLAVLSCVEKLLSVVNTISVERDWVVTIAADSESELQGD